MATIAFDAKRAFANATGLGNYSRSLIGGLSRLYPEHDYLLLAPHTRKTLCADLLERENVRAIRPRPPLAAVANPLWRRYGLVSVLRREKAAVYHGLSHELPWGIARSGVFSVVTIHDMLPFRHPELFKWPDRAIYRDKFRHACFAADRIIAVSHQTARDIMACLDPEGRSIDPAGVEVIHQGCDPAFHTPPAPDQAGDTARRLGLSGDFILYVGSVIERKNLLSLVKAMELLCGEGGVCSGESRAAPGTGHAGGASGTGGKPRTPLRLAVVGTGREYLQRVREYVRAHGLDEMVAFLGQVDFQVLPSLYRAARAFVYPSIYEGFGIPIIEAQHCLCPVVTSTGSCFPEAGGPHSLYVETRDREAPERLARAIRTVLEDRELAAKMAMEGKEYVKRFAPEIVAGKVMRVYEGGLLHL